LLMILGCQMLLFGMLSELIIHRTERSNERAIVAEVVGLRGDELSLMDDNHS